MRGRKQAKASVGSEPADAIKRACEGRRVSMAPGISAFMAPRAGEPRVEAGAAEKRGSIDTRGGRRRATAAVIARPEDIRDAGEGYKENIPENFRGGGRHEGAGQAARR
jgi:hypothetical protein